MGGYEARGCVHFFAMAALLAFVAVHLVMVALVPRTLRRDDPRPLRSTT